MIFCQVCFAFFVVGTTLAAVSTATTPEYSEEVEFFSRNLNLSWEGLAQALVPTSPNIENARCRAHSQLYLQELNRFTFWATSMFDATAKFPSGVLLGSNYEFGNFDECMKISVPAEPTPNDDFFTGKYCMAKVVLNIDDAVNERSKNPFTKYRPPDYNDSAWQQMAFAAVDRSKRPRNEIYWGICMPSSCYGRDLQVHLREIADFYNKHYNISISVEVPEEQCQINEPYHMTMPQALYLSMILVVVSIVLAASMYEYISMKRNNNKPPIGSSPGQKILLCFSLLRNLKKLVEFKDKEDKLQFINGIKVISMFLVIMGHRMMFGVGSPVINSDLIEFFYTRIEAMVLLNGPIIVDTFFCISGFLACYLLMLEFDNRKKKINFLFLYVHRIVRMSTVYAVIIGFYCILFSKMGSGPMWRERIVLEEERCRASWWANLLYINNYVNTDKICMFQSWYVTCDIHFFLLTPPIVWLLYKNPKAGVGLLGTLTGLSILSTFLVAFYGKLDALLLLFSSVIKDPVANVTFRNMYIPSHTRATPYLVGLAGGYLKYRIKKKMYNFSKGMVYLGWILAIALMEGTVYIAYIFYTPNTQYDSHISALYAAFHHFTWSICISWFLLATSTGNGTFIKPFLSWKPFTTLSRITYTTFLCHGGLQLYTAASIRSPNDTDVFNMVWLTFGDILMSYTGGFVLSMCFESPVLGLEKLIFGGEKQRKEVKESECYTIPVNNAETFKTNCWC